VQVPTIGVGRKISRGGGAAEKTKAENSTIKPPSTLSVSHMKIQESHGPLSLPHSADAHGSYYTRTEQLNAQPCSIVGTWK